MKKLFIILFIVLFAIVGCGYTNEQKSELKFYKNKALDYLEEKYGNYHYVVGSVNYDTVSNGGPIPIAEYTDDVIIEIDYIVESNTYDGFTVFYDSEKKEFSDNLQSKEINDAVKSQIFEPLFKEIEGYKYYNNSPHYNDIKLAYNSKMRDSYFKNKYENNIIKYMDNNNIFASTKVLVLSTKDNWKDIANNIYEKINHEIRDNISLELIFSNDNYFDEIEKPYTSYDEGTLLNDERIFGRVFLGKDINFYEYEYITVEDGVSMMSLTGNLFLEKGDIQFVKSNKDIEYLQELCPIYELSSNYPIYEIKFSDRVVGALRSDNNISIYAKWNSNELFFRKNAPQPDFFFGNVYYYEEGKSASSELNGRISFDINKTYYVWAGSQRIKK